MGSSPFRSFADRRFAPLPALQDREEIDRTARQVRLDNRDDSTVHQLAARWQDPWMGVTYRTRCCHVMTGGEGAILTTREATCGRCLGGGR